MDPLDQEKPWGFFGQMMLIACAIGLIYLIIRLAVVVPEYGWQLVAAMSVLAPLMYYFLAFRSGFAREQGVARPRFTRAQRVAQAVTAVLLAAVLSVPAFVAYYYFRLGALPWG